MCVSSFDTRFQYRFWDTARSLDAHMPSVWRQPVHGLHKCLGSCGFCQAQSSCGALPRPAASPSPQVNLPFEEQRRHLQPLSQSWGLGRWESGTSWPRPVWGSSGPLGWKVGAHADLANFAGLVGLGGCFFPTSRPQVGEKYRFPSPF